MKHLARMLVVVLPMILFSVHLSSGQENVDSAAVARIQDEGMNRSQLMSILGYVADSYGPRLSWSPSYLKAASWARKQLATWGLQNVHLEGATPLGRGWSLKSFSAQVVEPQMFPLIAFPKAWTPGTGSISGDAIYFEAETDSALRTYRGKLHGKFVLLSEPRDLKPHFKPDAWRVADSSLLKLADAGIDNRQRRFRGIPGDRRAQAILNFQKWELCEKEGAAAVLTISSGDGGNIFVSSATIPAHPDTPFTRRASAYSAKAPKILPQLAVGAEHYNRLVRLLKKGERVKIEMELDVAFTKEDSLYNIVAELPGTDLRDEIVMIGAHFDSWHGGTGATDNGTGSAVCLEAMRILKTLGLQPKRTIRIGLWGGEEEGLLGSRAYVTQHFADRGEVSATKKPEYEKFSVYFNNDNGSGKVRGVYMQGSEAVRPIFRAWLEPFVKMDASTLSLSNTGGTDHLSFDAVGLPGFQFIQDDLDYFTRTHHSTMDVYDRAQEDDLKQASVIMAAFAYNAAMRDEKFPRKELPAPSQASQ